jgi:hypothetical protein
MTVAQHKLRKRVYDVNPIDPHRFYRKAEIIRRRFFGYGASQFDEMVRKKALPALINPTLGDSRRASGLFGKTILETQAKIEAKAAARTKAKG